MKYFTFLTKLLVASLFIISCSSSDDDDPILIYSLPTNITYTNTIGSLMSQSCAVSGCHNTSTKAGGFSLTTYAEVVTAFKTKGALSEIENGTMPKNGAKLSTATIYKIKGWIAKNYTE